MIIIIVIDSSASILHKKPALLKDVYRLLDDKSLFWDDIGRELGVSRKGRMALSNISSYSHEQKLEAVLEMWLQQSGDSPTWDQLIKGLIKLGFIDSVKRILTHFGKDETFIKNYCK